MNNIQQFLLDSKNSLMANDDKVNSDSFNALIKFNDLWNERHQSIVDQYNLPAFHLWESGFAKGAATPEEIESAVQNIRGYGWTKVTEANIFEFLDSRFLYFIGPKVKRLIEEYEAFCKQELSE